MSPRSGGLGWGKKPKGRAVHPRPGHAVPLAPTPAPFRLGFDMNFRRFVAPVALVAAGLLAVPLLHGVPARADTPAPAPGQVQAQNQAAPQAVALPSLAPLVDSVKAAVVNVEVTSRVERDDSGGEDPFEQFFGRGRRDPRQQIRQGAGSGFVIDPRGYILTNNHVVEGAFNIRVKFDDGRSMEAEVLGTDRLTDVALIKLKAPPANLP